jgi:hypothetical protein
MLSMPKAQLRAHWTVRPPFDRARLVGYSMSMRHLRVVMDPIQTTGASGRRVVRGFLLDFSSLGRAVGPTLVDAAVTIELSCVLITKIRADERSAPEPLATLTGTLSADGASTQFSLDAASPDSSLGEVLEQGGHRRPRRKLMIELRDGSKRPLLLPDTMQVPRGFMEVSAKLTVNGEVHADVDQNEILDVPLLPLSFSHALFNFVDSSGQPLAQLNAEFEVSGGEPIAATTDDFGDLFLDASEGQTYTLLQVLPAEDDRVAVMETSVSEDAQAVA